MLQQLKENPLGLQSLKDFPLRSKVNSFTKGFSIECLKEKYVYRITKDFPLSQLQSYNSVAQHSRTASKNSIIDSAISFRNLTSYSIHFWQIFATLQKRWVVLNVNKCKNTRMIGFSITPRYYHSILKLIISRSKWKILNSRK